MIDQSTEEKTWGRALTPLLYYWAIGLAIAMITPRDAFLHREAANTVFTAVASVIPSIERLSRISEFPQLTRTFAVVMWLLQPLFTIRVIWIAPKKPVMKVLSWGQLLLVLPISLLLLVALGIVAPFVFQDVSTSELTLLGGRGRAALYFISSSRFGMGALGSAVLCFSSFCQAFVLLMLRYWILLLLLKLKTGGKNA